MDLETAVSSKNSVDRLFELGKLNCERGDYISAAPLIKQAAEGFYAVRDFGSYLKCQNLLLRIHGEREEFEAIHQIKEKLQDLVMREGFELNSKTYYTLAVCATYKNQIELALDYAQKSLSLALATDNKEDICHSICALAYCYSSPEVGRYTDALKEIYNLKIFFQVYAFPEIQTSAQILNADILRQLKKFEEATEVAWKAYEEIKNTKSLVYSTYLLVMLGAIYLDSGEKDLSRMYLALASRSVDPRNQIRLTKMIRGYQDRLGFEDQMNFDLVFDEINHSVTERKLGKIDFKNQFILLDLLKLFVQNQGTVYTKEHLVESVWRQDYDPAVHDNKIYVTIKRLRKMIEPDFDKPKYIFRAKNGYYMNKAARVQFERVESN